MPRSNEPTAVQSICRLCVFLLAQYAVMHLIYLCVDDGTPSAYHDPFQDRDAPSSSTSGDGICFMVGAFAVLVMCYQAFKASDDDFL